MRLAMYSMNGVTVSTAILKCKPLPFLLASFSF